MKNGPPVDPDIGTEIATLIPALRAFARSFHREVDKADDLVQDTLTRAIASIHTFQRGTRLKSWLFTIMRNRFYTDYKRFKREPTGEEQCVSSLPIMQPTQEWSQRGVELKAAMQRLPDAQREVLVLIGVLGVSYEEAAKVCDCELGTIKSRLNRARKRLASELGETSCGSVLEQDVMPTVAKGVGSADRHPSVISNTNA